MLFRSGAGQSTSDFAKTDPRIVTPEPEDSSPRTEPASATAGKTPVKAPPGEGKVGNALAQLGISREDRRNQEFVDKELGPGYVAGSYKANMALLNKYKPETTSPRTEPTPTKPVPPNAVTSPTTGQPWVSGTGDVWTSGQEPAPAKPAPGKNPWEGKDPAKAEAWSKLTPRQQAWMGLADPTDSIIVSRAKANNPAEYDLSYEDRAKLNKIGRAHV